MSENKTIRFGTMCQSPVLKAWEGNCMKQALKVENIELSLIIYPSLDVKIKKRGLSTDLVPLDGTSKMFFHMYENFLFRPKCNANVDFRDRFKKIPSLYCATLDKNGSEYLRKEDIQKIRNADLDFIILFSGFVDLKGEILKASKHGIWTYKHGDINQYTANPPCFWEIYNNDDVTRAVLYKLSGKKNKNLILKDGYYKTLKHSYVLNFNNVHFENARFLKDMCYELNNADVKCNEYLTTIKRTQNVTTYSKPNNAEFIKFLFKLSKNKLKKFFKNLFLIEQWNIGYIQCSAKDLIEKNDGMDIHWILSPSKRRYFADPFAIRYNKKVYILFENYEYRTNKAKISSIPIKASVTNSDIEISLKKHHHLSYPFLFKYNRKIYMIPGEWESNKVTLYEAKNFPAVWQKSAVLIEGIQAVDPTLAKYKDLWWLFCTRKDEGPDLRLFIYYSNNLLGPWSPHKKNPVKTDIRSARPGGKIFEYKKSLIRPSQDSSKTYGGRIILNKITKLTTNEFHEEPIKFIETSEKSRYKKGIHTISPADKITIVDSKRYLFSTFAIRKSISKKLNNIISETKFHHKYNFISIPKFVERNEYINAIDKIVEVLSNQKGIKSIYQMGSINHPGISDIDIFVVFDDTIKNTFNPRSYFNEINIYLFTHNIGGICKTHFNKINKFSLFHNLNCIWGENFPIEQKNLNRSEIKSLKIQTALEYLFSNFIDLSIQLKYKVIKLRTLLQHIKAIRYDLEFLSVTSGDLYNLVHQLLRWLDEWFENPIELKELCDWIDNYHIKLKNFIVKQTLENSFYIPNWANTRYSRNVKLNVGKTVGYKFEGNCFPKFLTGINKRTFNINSRINQFYFEIPYEFIPKDKILEERINYYKEIMEHSLAYFPNYAPLIPSFAGKIILDS